ncbi:hypothetical protein KC352_g39494, partial [Hortaea werneckii]
HVSGDQSWIAGARSKAKRGPGRPPRSREDTEGSATSMPTVKVDRKRPSVENVQDVPEQRKRKFSDPQVQGITFYHALSKQRIRSGETLSESEDELYDDRLIHSQRQAFRQLGLSKAEAAFHEAFNRHMDAEQPSSTILLREAIVRFARKNCVSLVDAVWLGAFEAKLKHLQAHRVIGDDVVAFCLEMRPTIQQRRKYGKQDALNGDGDFENVGIDGDGDTEMENSVLQASPYERQRGANGRFTRSPNANSSFEEASSVTGISDRRQQKAHKWAGGGADRGIVEAGRAASANGRRELHARKYLPCPESRISGLNKWRLHLMEMGFIKEGWMVVWQRTLNLNQAKRILPRVLMRHLQPLAASACLRGTTEQKTRTTYLLLPTA